jgi:histidine triad (HIT) family protein
MAECIFCQIVAGKIPSEVVYQDDSVLAFKDIHPKAPVHVLIIPKKHIASLADLKIEDQETICHLMESVNIVAQKQGAEGNYKVVINTGPAAGQVVMHLHLHLLAGKKFTSFP